MATIDTEVLAQLAEDIPMADVRRIVSVFADDMQRLVPQMRTAAQAGDLAQWRRILHSIAGAAGAVGGAALEQAARQGMNWPDAQAAGAAAQATLVAHLADQTVVELGAHLAEIGRMG